MLDPIRRAELVEELGQDFLLELTVAFWGDAWDLLDFGITSLVRNDIVELGKVLHTLSGSSRNLGFQAIANAADAAKASIKLGVRPDLGQLQAVMLRTSVLLVSADGRAGQSRANVA